MSKKLLAIIPAFNEEDSLERTVEELKGFAPYADFVVINDGSTDGTAAVCNQHGYPVINMPVNVGLARGFHTGMVFAYRNDYEFAVQFDADGQHKPEFLRSMLDVLEKGDADIAIGSRFLCSRKSFSLRMIGSRLITMLIELTTGATVSDPTSGLRMFNREMIERFALDATLRPEPDSIAFLMRKGARVVEVQVDMREREAGESYLGFSKAIGYMVRSCAEILFVQWFKR